MKLFSWFRKKDPVPARTGKRRFIAANIDRLNSQFVSTNTSIDYDLYAQSEVLIARARELAKNNEYVRRYLAIITNNVLGSKGIAFQSLAKRQGSPFLKGQEAVEKAWHAWGKKGNCDVTTELAWQDIERLTIEGVKRDGEVFIHFVGSDLRVEIIDPLFIPIKLNDKLANGNTIVMGVELTPSRRPVAYYVSSSKSELNPSIYRFANDKYERIPAEQMLHIKHAEFAHQTRGFSHMAAAIPRLNQLQRYDEATIVAARVGASKMVFHIESESGAGYTGDEETDDFEFIEDIEPGLSMSLPAGSDIKTFDPGEPSTAYSDFVKWSIRAIASGLNISYHALAQDMETVNFSSARIATLEDREAFKTDQEWLTRELHEPVFERWLTSALLNQQIFVGGNAVGFTRYDEFSLRSWQGRRWAWVDPAKDVVAAEKGVALGTTSRSRLIREQGLNPDEVFKEIADEQEQMKKLGIEVQANGTQAGNADSQTAV